jgi:hypothetical protein
LRARYLEQQAATLSAQAGILEQQPACLAKTSFLRGKLPRAYAWVRTKTGAARRVTILFDSGASHCFVHPRVLADLEVTPDSAVGPGTLQMADDHVIACKGTTDGLQILAGPFGNECNWWRPK